MAVNSSEWANVVLPSQVCQDPCSLPSPNSCSIEQTSLFHAAFQNPQDSSQAEKHYYFPPSSIPGWLVEAEPRVISTGDEPNNTEIKWRNIFLLPNSSFHQLRAGCSNKPLLLSGTYGSWVPWMCSKHSSLLRVPECHQQLGQVLSSRLCPPLPYLSPAASG